MGRLARLLAATAGTWLLAGTALAADPPRPVVVVGTDMPGHPLVHSVAARAAELSDGRDYELRFRLLPTRTLRAAFARGEIDVLTAPVTDLPRLAKERGTEVRLFAPLTRWTPGPMLIVARGSQARRLSDLKGRPVAILPRSRRSGHEEAAVLAATEAPLERYLRLRVRDDPAGALERGEVAAAFVEAPGRALLPTGRYRVVFSVQQAYRKAFSDPAVLRSGLVTDLRFTQARPDALNDLRGAVQDAWGRYAKDPAGVAREGARWGGLSAKVIEDAGEVLQLARLTPAERGITPRDVRTWGSLFPLMARANGGSPPAPEVVRGIFVLQPGGVRSGR